LRLDVPFNLDATLCCGQVFRWERHDDWWYGVVGSKGMRVRQVGGALEFSDVDEAFVKRYFSLDHSLEQISSEIGKDKHVRAALRKFWGLRLVRQEPWECLVSFICATYKSVAAIRQMLQRLSARFGERIVFEGCEFHAFPCAERLAGAGLRELEACGLGYRARYVLETSRLVAGGFDLEALRKMSYEDAKRELMEFPGVGLKVADCVLLFSLDKLEAFPVDVWVKRILMRHYGECFDEVFAKKLSAQSSPNDSQYERLAAFGRAYFGRYAGYAQEYLYHYERLAGNRKIEKGSVA
jgi:N-glycosylase/DNA lyase